MHLFFLLWVRAISISMKVLLGILNLAVGSLGILRWCHKWRKGTQGRLRGPSATLTGLVVRRQWSLPQTTTDKTTTHLWDPVFPHPSSFLSCFLSNDSQAPHAPYQARVSSPWMSFCLGGQALRSTSSATLSWGPAEEGPLPVIHT